MRNPMPNKYTIEIKIKKSDRKFGWDSRYKMSRWEIETIKWLLKTLSEDPIREEPNDK